MFYFTYHDIDYTADDDGNVDSDDQESDIDAATYYWSSEGWAQALQDEADDRGDWEYEQRRDDRMEDAE